MHTLKVLSVLFALIFCISMLYGCGSDEKGDLSMRFFSLMSESQVEPQPEVQPESQPDPSSISFSVNNLDLDHSAGSCTIQVKANCAWSISFRESSDNKEGKEMEEIDWIKAEPSFGTGDCEVTLTFEDNKIAKIDAYSVFIDDRVCELVVTSESGITATALIKQEGIPNYDKVEIGDKIEFGRYPQSADADINDSNTYEPLTWIVKSLYTGDACAIGLTTEKIIDNQEMDTHYPENLNYPLFLHSSNLYAFLNNSSDSFYTKAFSEEEKMVLRQHVVIGVTFNTPFYVSILREYNDVLGEYDTEYNNNITDESICYMHTCCKPTDYAKAMGISISDNGYSPYWLLSYNHNPQCSRPDFHLPVSSVTGGTYIRHNLAVGSDGEIYCEYSENKLGVRPEINIQFRN